jgi:hypothetical protein
LKKIKPNRRQMSGKASENVPKPAPSNSYSAMQSRHWRRQQIGEPCPQSCRICKRLARRAREEAAQQAPVQAGLPVPVHAIVPVSSMHSELPDSLHAPGQVDLHAGPHASRHATQLELGMQNAWRDADMDAHVGHLRAATHHAEHNHPAVLLGLLLLCAGAAVGGFVMAWDSLTGSYHGISAPARALAVFAAELVFGHFAYVAYRAKGWPAALPCGVVVLLCAFVDIGIAGMQGAVAERQAKDAIDAAPAATFQPTTKCESKDTPAEYVGHPVSLAQWQAGEDKRMDKCRADQAQERQQWDTAQAATKTSRLSRAGERSFFEVIMPGLMPLLGALAAAAVMPLFEMLVEARRRRRAVAP